MTETERGVDLDVLAIHPPHPLDTIRGAVRQALLADGLRPLESIDAIQLDALLEWCEPTERCVAITLPRSSDTVGSPRAWQLVYDTRFSSVRLAVALGAALEGATLLYFNLQEARDGTLVLFHSDIRAGFSAQPERVQDFAALELEPLTTQVLKEFLPGDIPTDPLRAVLGALQARLPGERVSKMQPRSGGVYDAQQQLARLAGLPHLYRFFEGWMKSNLDWDEDAVEDVCAFTTRAP